MEKYGVPWSLSIVFFLPLRMLVYIVVFRLNIVMMIKKKNSLGQGICVEQITEEQP